MPDSTSQLYTAVQHKSSNALHVDTYWMGRSVANLYAAVQRSSTSALHTTVVYRRSATLGPLVVGVGKIADMCLYRHVRAFRKFLNDFASSNAFLQTEQLSDVALAYFLDLALKDFNQYPPVITYFTPCTMKYDVCWYYGAAWKVFESLAMTDVRNAYPFQAGDVAINPDKSQQYLQLAQMAMQQYMALRDRIKHSININSGWGGWWSW